MLEDGEKNEKGGLMKLVEGVGVQVREMAVRFKFAECAV